ncbi:MULTISPECIES: hypothetical protein [unclassified Knoellia]|uniref:hypothetical protein n=1 Tax=Knoellia altitudinis TaxID=3404795 RepID=UPI0036155942
MTEVYPRWTERGIGDDEAARWVRLLRAWVLTSVVDVLGERATSPWMDWALVSGCLLDVDHEEARQARGWLDSGIPVERAEHYLPGGLTLGEAEEVERSGGYSADSLDVLAALRRSVGEFEPA